MKVFCLILASLTLCSRASGGELQKMQEKIAGMGCIGVSVKLEDNDVLVVSDGHRYHLASDVTEVWCDGTDQWIYSPSSNELTITSFNPASMDLSENPAAVLTADILKTYDVISESGGLVVLKAKKKVKVSYPDLSMTIDRSGMPRLITLTSAAGETYSLKVNSIKSVPNPASASFAPPADLLEKAFVNDMR